MTPKITEEEFNTYVNERLDKIKHLLLVKGKEYIRNGDKFHNFNRGATKTGQSPERVLHGMLLKHDISYCDMLDDIDNGVKLTDALVDEKFGDILTFYILQYAQMKHRIKHQ